MSIRTDPLTLQLFISAIEEQSIAKAAEKNNIAVSAVSRRISDLEMLMKVDLIHRNSKGVSPTGAGEVLLEHARVIVGNLIRMEAELLGHSQGTRGYIRLMVNTSATLESLADELSDFLAIHPQVKLDLNESISPTIIQAVADNRVDIGIFGGNIMAPELQIFPYREDNLVAVLPSSHPLAAQESVRFSDLADSELVSLEDGSSIDALCMRAAAELGQRPRVRIRVGSFDAVFRMVAAKMGVGVTPREIAEGRTDPVKVTLRPLDEPWARRLLVLGVREYQALSTPAKLLVNYLCKRR
ncbi:MAG: LysR family transcriptional regulator [Ancalomicrobiaceae bacterium]|nr:LysR family transcriptional regulator [Ancalomicrobiaceae bacterium]